MSPPLTSIFGILQSTATTTDNGTVTAAEGTEANPIVLPGVTVQQFDDLLSYFFKSVLIPMEMLSASRKQEVCINLLSVGSLWEIDEAKQYAKDVLRGMNLPAECILQITRQFAIHEWINGAGVPWKSGTGRRPEPEDVRNRKTSGIRSRTGDEIVGYSRKHHNSAGTKIKTKRKRSATQDSSPIGTTPGARTGGKPEWCRSCRNEEVDRSGAGTRKTGNGPEIKSKYKKDVQRLKDNLGVELKIRIERGDSVHERKHGTTLNFPDEVLDVAKTDIY
ncbi:hypothetical protein DFH09DRAFT_1100534 [Mycena vulgaris]|nr:hypothetical protein DFH09DRAFT_1100534 [Mycena vulgaris]